MGLLATLALSLGALALFALAMARHHRRLFGSLPSKGRALALRTLGWVLLVLSPLPWMAQHGSMIALVAWLFCGLPVVGLVIVGLCSYAPSKADSESSGAR